MSPWILYMLGVSINKTWSFISSHLIKAFIHVLLVILLIHFTNWINVFEGWGQGVICAFFFFFRGVLHHASAMPRACCPRCRAFSVLVVGAVGFHSIFIKPFGERHSTKQGSGAESLVPCGDNGCCPGVLLSGGYPEPSSTVPPLY